MLELGKVQFPHPLRWQSAIGSEFTISNYVSQDCQLKSYKLILYSTTEQNNPKNVEASRHF